MAYLGLNVYLWGDLDQDRFLVDCLLPLSEELRRERLLDEVWFDRFDARGPHVFALFTLPEAGVDATRDRLASSVDSYLRDHFSETELPSEAIARRHEECRGKTQSAVDREPGMAKNNSWSFFEHAADGYPFFLTRKLATHAEIWSQVDKVTRWTLNQLQVRILSGNSPLRAAVQWAAEIGVCLGDRRSAAEYWRYHATTLLPPLGERLEQDESAVETSLPSWIGEKNLAALARLWAAGGLEPEPRAALRRLTEIASSLHNGNAQWALLREISHCVFKQLGLPVARQIPLVLFGWSSNLDMAHPEDLHSST